MWPFLGFLSNKNEGVKCKFLRLWVFSSSHSGFPVLKNEEWGIAYPVFPVQVTFISLLILYIDTSWNSVNLEEVRVKESTRMEDSLRPVRYPRPTHNGPVHGLFLLYKGGHPPVLFNGKRQTHPPMWSQSERERTFSKGSLRERRRETKSQRREKRRRWRRRMRKSLDCLSWEEPRLWGRARLVWDPTVYLVERWTSIGRLVFRRQQGKGD